MKYLLLLAFSCLAFAGCDLLGSDDAREPVVTGVFVANQGNFSDGNGSVSTYDPATESATVGAITGLSSLVQSVTLDGSTLYVVANTGGRVDVYDANTLQSDTSITGLLSPRYMAVSDTLGFVTNFYGDPATFSGGRVSVLDLRNNRKIRDVPVGDNPEGIAVAGRRVYVANSGFGLGSTVSVLDARTGDFVETIDVACDGPRSLAVDREDEVWVFCTGQTVYDPDGNVTAQTNGAIRILDGATGRLAARLDVDSPIGAAIFGQDVFYSDDAQEVFVVLGERRVARYSTASNTHEATFGPVDGPSISAVAYDAARERLYLGRPAGYTAAGQVTIHRRDGTQTGQFTAGIVPTFITLREETR